MALEPPYLRSRPGRKAIVLDSLFSNIDVIQTSLHGLTSRQRAIGQNVANADTPGYKRVEVAYEARLRQAIKKQKEAGGELDMQASDARHFTLGPGAKAGEAVTIRQVRDESYRNDQNNVDIELEMATLAETNIRYNTMATLARNKFDGIKTILREVR